MPAPRSLKRMTAKVLVRAAEGMLNPAIMQATERDIFGETVAANGFTPGDGECSFCGEPVIVPTYDPETVLWLGDSSPVYCSLVCKEGNDERRINAAGGGAS